ncbi:tripartite tricarboxylate transporter substrate binding protein [Pelagibacterium sp. H642]|uniref:Bug family tripartite tricarboxylate transporter substrate binding protein n=1 Tax=Pelagibacterium sp. H642 TaxID=1881069 RepID=UPI0028164089|nr:tripartite tricarboxylate transporter substrate binding protein [Pelagibacterium sp. H642]WMT89375.1 tripartite tricarboxylate transporter substrate binding protein [Pelagibacterium sp. H642]
MKTFLSRRGFTALGSAVAASILLLGAAGQAIAQTDYPNRDITLIVPYAPGASGDILARQYGTLLGEILGVTVVVTNAPGGSGTIGTVEIFGAEPDGYTLGYGHNSPLAIQPHNNAGLPYRGVEDFTTIGGIGHQSGTVTVNSASQWQTFAEFVEAAKAEPGAISISVGAAGNVKDMQLQQFQQAAGVEFNIVPFAGGGAEAVVAVLGQIVDAVSVNASSVRGQIESGDLRPLAMFTGSVQDEIDGFEVITAEDYPGMQYLQDSSGIIAPAELPGDIVAILESAHQTIMENDEFLAVLEADSYIVDATNSEQYREQLLNDYANFGEILGN